MQLVAVDSLEVGMVLAQDVITDSFVHIISASTTVTPEIIVKLKQLDIEFVYVNSNKLEQEVQQGKSNVTLENLSLEEAVKYYYGHVSESLKNVFNDLKFGEGKVDHNLSEALAPLLDTILSHNNVLSSMRCFDKHDDYLLKHSIEVGVLSATIGKWLHLPKDQVLELGVAGTLHDVGKIKVPKYIMNKPGHLTQQEYGIAKKHAEHGLEYLNLDGSFSQAICDGVLYHHERFNGSGYPHGLVGSQIPLYARIIAVADVFAAITSDRVYQIKSSSFVAAEVVKGMAFDELDPKIANLFLKRISEHYVGNKVLLSTGEEGEVIYLNKFSINKPLIKVGDRFIDLTMQSDISIKDVLS